MNFKSREKLLASVAALSLLGISPQQTFAAQITTNQAVQQTKKITGNVSDAMGPIIGATVKVKGTKNAAVTDFDGNYTLNVGAGQTVEVTYVGYITKSFKVGGQNKYNITLTEDNNSLQEVVVVGYGTMKKSDLAGASASMDEKTLKQTPITNVDQAFQGKISGVNAVQTSGQPGSAVAVSVRGIATINANSEPLYVVDGVIFNSQSNSGSSLGLGDKLGNGSHSAVSPLSLINPSDIVSMEVLKDASATAVYGVKGANGVILVTTKRGQEGKAKIDIGFNATLKAPSKLPNKYDSYDALMLRNQVVERELGIYPEGVSYLRPQSFIDNYRNQTTQEQRERYANVDWQDALFKKSAMSYNANVNVSGGTKFVKYFASADFVHEGDLFREYDNGRNYNSGYGYNRINVRSNLDFAITSSTTLKVNVAGSNGVRKAPWSNMSNSEWQIGQQWAGAYNIAPDVFLPQYSDGSWGFYPSASNVSNSAQNLAIGGTAQATTTRINTDFTLEQKLDFITKGLNFRGTISWDNVFVETGRGINDLNNEAQTKYIDPETGQVTYGKEFEGNNKFDWQQGVNWSTEGGSVDNNQTVRNLYYQLQLNWARKFGQHDVSAMGLFSRQENARGSVMPTYREDWAFRATYSYAGRYNIEYNGAYNGSEKFSKNNRFAFFNSGAIGWTITEENFMKSLRDNHIIDMLKFRASYGEIGDDNIGDPFDSTRRWLYMSQWAYGGKTTMDLDHTESIYTWYRQNTLGNDNVKWETVKKTNFGIDYGFLGGLITGSLDFFCDRRNDILIFGSNRSVPSYFGTTAPTINKGKVRTSGYEWELKLNKVFANGLRLWGNFNMTHAKNKVILKDDALFTPNYQKEAGFAMNQYHSYIDKGFINNIDDLIGSPAHDSNDNHRLVGDYYIVDFNGDGVVDSRDSAPVGYSSSPQNTYNATIGFEWKGFSAFAQFYGVTNVTRDVSLTSFGNMLDNVYDTGTWWNKNQSNPECILPRWGATASSYTYGTQFMYDGSYIRLKNVEIAYTWTKGWIKALGVNYLKIYLNGNNLWLWTRMPDDREANLGGGGWLGAYPTVRRFNLGVKFSL